ncbi:MAG: FliG C-terminal domain-containing protein [Elusimicrobiota bacterium]
MRWPAIAFLLMALSARAADLSTDEALVSERLASRAMAVVDGILGPGRARVLIEVRGERLQMRTEAEIVTPMTQAGGPASSVKEALRVLDLPGYVKEKENVPSPESKSAAPAAAQSQVPFHKSFEQSLRDAGFEIKKIEAVLVLDSALSDAQVRDVSQLMPQLLHVDDARGDKMSIVRVAMLPAWKSAFSTAADWRMLAFASGAVLAALFIAMIFSGAVIRAARVFAMELSARRPPEAALSAPQTELLPELTPGMPAGFIEAESTQGSGAAQLSLGQRFDFLRQADVEGAARILAAEKPEDLAQIFAYLAKTLPDTASRLFARLPAQMQADASASLLKLHATDPDKLAEIEDRLKVSLLNGLSGSERLATILSRVSSEARTDLLGRLAERDMAGTEEIESRLFVFEDISTLADADFRRLLGELPFETWGAALRGAPHEILARVLAEIPKGPQEQIRQEASNPQPKDKINAARSKILDVLHQLAAKGLVHSERLGSEGEVL